MSDFWQLPVPLSLTSIVRSPELNGDGVGVGTGDIQGSAVEFYWEALLVPGGRRSVGVDADSLAEQ